MSDESTQEGVAGVGMFIAANVDAWGAGQLLVSTERGENDQTILLCGTTKIIEEEKNVNDQRKENETKEV